jgi:hypothetical protein
LAKNVTLKNLSMSWGVDSNVTTVGPVANVMVQNCIIAESLYSSIHPLGPRGNGALIGETGREVRFVGNLMAANHDRNIRWKYDTQGEMLNNVIYGWGGTSSWNTTNISDLEKKEIPIYLDVIGNVYRAGPNGLKSAYAVYSADTPLNSRIYIHDLRGAAISNVELKYRAATRVLTGPATIPASETFEAVMNKAGSRPWDRNRDDLRVISGVRAGTLSIRNRVSTWPVYAVNRRTVDVTTDPISEDELNVALVDFER